MRVVALAVLASSFLVGAVAQAAAPAPINFDPARCALSEFTEAQGWRPDRHPRFFADVNGDKKQDIVGFKDDGVYVARSVALKPPLPARFHPVFSSPMRWSTDFGSQSGWDANLHERTLADVDGNGRADVVGFGNKGVFVAISDGQKFRSTMFWLADFGAEQGWRKDGTVFVEGERGLEISNHDGPQHIRMTADVDGDKRADVVGFGDRGVFYALSKGTRFGETRLATGRFGYQEGWRVSAYNGGPSNHIRTMADVTGDRRADIVAMGDHGVYFAVSLGAYGFNPAFTTQVPFFGDRGFNASHVRALGDVDGDRRADFMAIQRGGVQIFYSTGDLVNLDVSPVTLMPGFGTDTGWASPATHPRMLADLNADGTADFVGFGDDGVWTALTNFGDRTSQLQPVFTVAAFGAKDPNWRRAWRSTPDINGDGRADLAGFGADCVWTALSQ